MGSARKTVFHRPEEYRQYVIMLLLLLYVIRIGRQAVYRFNYYIIVIVAVRQYAAERGQLGSSFSSTRTYDATFWRIVIITAS